MEAGAFAYELEPMISTQHYTVSKLRFPSLISTPDPENNTVHAEYFAPVGFGPGRPAVIVLHILGADFPLSRYMAARMADRGIAALFVKLPYYGEPQTAWQERGRSVEAPRVVGHRTHHDGNAASGARRAPGWMLAGRTAERRSDPSRSFRNQPRRNRLALTAAVDPAINQGAFLLAGGDLSTVLWEMPEGAPFRKIWIESGRTKADLKKLTDPFDPLTYASGLTGKRMLFIAGKVDEVVPPRARGSCGKPPASRRSPGTTAAITHRWGICCREFGGRCNSLSRLKQSPRRTGSIHPADRTSLLKVRGSGSYN